MRSQNLKIKKFRITIYFVCVCVVNGSSCQVNNSNLYFHKSVLNSVQIQFYES